MNTSQNARPKTIKSLIDMIQQEIVSGQEQVRFAVETQKVITYWKIGKFISSHLLLKRGKENYGEYLFPQLSSATGISVRTLYRIVQFYESFPKLLSRQLQLTWSHYLLLMGIEDPAVRNNLVETASAGNLSTRALQDLMKKEHLLTVYSRSPGNNLLINNGLPYVYRLKQLVSSPVLNVDFGFNIFRQLPEKKAAVFSVDDFIRVKKGGNKFSYEKVTDVVDNHLYNYKAVVEEIIDGDTIWLNIDLGFGMFTRQKVRFRGINAGTLVSESGKKAFRYISNRLSSCPFILVKSYWRDKFNRYLVDIFYNNSVQKVEELVEAGAFLNQELLDKGLAKRY